MYIVIIGGGRVGYYLGRALIQENHEVLIVEKDTLPQTNICNNLGSVCVHGDGCEVATLEEVGTSRADIFIAVTGDDEDNLISCQLAKHRFNVPRTIARLSNPANKTVFRQLGIDVTISSTDIIMEHIQGEVPTHSLTHLLEIEDRGLEIVVVRVPSESSTVGKHLSDVELPPNTVVPMIIHYGSRPVLPTPETVIEERDQIVAVTLPESEEALRLALRGDLPDAKAPPSEPSSK
jgi:trk system potassium uptake protein